MVVDLPRRWRWAIAGACAIAAVMALMFVVITRSVETGAPQEPGPLANNRAVLPLTTLAEPAAAPVPEAPPRALSEVRGADELQVCGGGWVKMQANAIYGPEDFGLAAGYAQARERVLANLRSDPSELARAVTLMLAMINTQENARRAARDSSGLCPASGCEISREAVAEIQQTRDALARLAASATDPRVYAITVRACSAHKSVGACQLITPARWAQLDPGNAAPWLFMLSDLRRGDRAALDEALHQIATSQRIDLGVFAAPGAIVEAAPDGDSSLLAAWVMVAEATIAEAPTNISGYQALSTACAVGTLRDSNRAQVCSAAADLLTDRSTTLFDNAIGQGIGRRVGWPSDRIDRMRGERAAYVASLSSSAPGSDQDFSCARVRRELDIIRRNATLGEMGALREWVAQSGMKPEDFVQAERARQLALREIEKAAASAPASQSASTATPR
jgi:hypothetical protein